jgi:hypothetical protein
VRGGATEFIYDFDYFIFFFGVTRIRIRVHSRGEKVVELGMGGNGIELNLKTSIHFQFARLS